LDAILKGEAMQEHRHAGGSLGAWYKTRWGIALIGFAALSVLLLAYEHRLHIPFGNLLVILPLFACIGLHSLMHGSHGGHGGHGGRGDPAPGDLSRTGVGGPADDPKDVQP
jgi:hypothetical protein